MEVDDGGGGGGGIGCGPGGGAVTAVAAVAAVGREGGGEGAPAGNMRGNDGCLTMMQIEDSTNQEAAFFSSNEEHQEIVPALGLVGSNGGEEEEEVEVVVVLQRPPAATAATASDWGAGCGSGSGRFNDHALLPPGLRKRHDSMSFPKLAAQREASSSPSPRSSAWTGDGSSSFKETALPPLRLRKRQDTLPSARVSVSSSPLDASVYQTPMSRVAATATTTATTSVDAPASFDSYDEQDVPFRFRRNQEYSPKPTVDVDDDDDDDDADDADNNDDSEVTGVDARQVSTSSSTVYKPFASDSPATARTLLAWNHGHGDESDSGWSTVSRRSSTSVMSEVSSSSNSELSSFFNYHPPNSTWWPDSNTRAVYHDDDDAYSDYASNTRRSVMMRRMFHSVMHGVVLALQSLAALAVLSVFVWMTVWKNPDAEPEFWTWLWEMPSMAISLVLILCVVTMITHEVRVLSAVALLYLQAAILFMTSVSVLIMWVSVAEQSGEVVQSILVGCCVFLWGMSSLGFLRAVVIWRVTELEEEIVHQGLLHDDIETYGTIDPSG